MASACAGSARPTPPVNRTITLDFYRKDAAGPTDPKPIYLPETGSELATALVNVATMHAAFDYQAVANSFYIETAPERYEVSVILAPAIPAAGRRRDRRQPRSVSQKRSRRLERNRDRREPSIASTSPTNAATDTGAWQTTNGRQAPIDFSSVFQLPDGNPDNLPAYVRAIARAGTRCSRKI